jgi:hypothetical protein
VIVECNAWTLPQERYNTEWVKEKGVGVVLHSFSEIVTGVRQLLQPGELARLRKNVAALRNEAVFEIPEILAGLLAGNSSAPQAANGHLEGVASR